MHSSLFLGSAGNAPVTLPMSMLNRHGVIFGATGTGKTTTLRLLAEQLSANGVPIFLADVKGDLAGAMAPGTPTEALLERARAVGMDAYRPRAFPVECFDVFAEDGLPLRTTISAMGPLLLARILGLNETQTGVLSICFSVADEHGLLLIDMKDLRAVLHYIDEHKADLRERYGNIATASVGAILRPLLLLEEQGGDQFFGEPALDIDDLFRTDAEGFGYLNLLAASRLLRSPTLYSTFLLWLLSSLYESLPEVGDLPKPKMVFFFDEAHLLFSNLAPALRVQLEQMVRLSRSKGLSIFFVSQNPLDLPEEILGQCANKFQHALHAYTPKEQQAIRRIAQSFRQDGRFSVEEALVQLRVGEALVSVLDQNGVPTVVERTLIAPPQSQLQAIDPLQRRQHINASTLYAKYAESVDPRSAYEVLTEQKEARRQEDERQAQAHKEAQEAALRQKEEARQHAALQKQIRSEQRAAAQSPSTKFANQVIGSIGRELGRQITRGFLGIFKK